MMLPSSEIALEMYKHNQLDSIPFFHKKQWVAIRKVPGLAKQLPDKPTKQGRYYLGFDHSRPPFDDADVRRAIATAVDKQFILNKAVGIIGDVSDAFINRSAVESDSDTKSCPPKLDTERARRILAFAKKRLYPEGEDFPEISISGSSVDVEIVQLIQKVLKKNLGITVVQKKKVEDFSTPSHLFVVKKQAEYAHPLYFLAEFINTDGNLHWNSQKYIEYKELFNRALKEKDSSQQRIFYEEAEQILCKEYVIIPLFFSKCCILKETVDPRCVFAFAEQCTADTYVVVRGVRNGFISLVRYEEKDSRKIPYITYYRLYFGTADRHSSVFQERCAVYRCSRSVNRRVCI